MLLAQKILRLTVLRENAALLKTRWASFDALHLGDFLRSKGVFELRLDQMDCLLA